MKKKLLGRRKQSNFSSKDTNNGIEENSYSNALSTSALERLQLHMQLQSLQNPFSFYNNPALWPKLHPIQEKMIHSLQSLNDGSNPVMQNALPNSPHDEQGQKGEFYKPQHDGAKINNPDQVHLLENIPLSNSGVPFVASGSSTNPMHSSLAPRSEAIHVQTNNNVGFQQLGALQNELDEILNNRTMGYVPQEDHDMASGFDCFREMNDSKDSLIWWSNDSDTKSASSNSWESSATPALLTQGMFQDYELGYSL